ncbi:MAG: histidine kinase [Verrucomicrobiae bacterium]|nr:histidine kinase [Verrucomicrobiae bacterium]
MLCAAFTSAAENTIVTSGDYLRRQWDVEDGLPDDIVTAIVQTRDGYLWIGTPRGLARFDGVNFRVFTPANSPGLASANVRLLAEATDGALWIGLDQGGLARRRNGVFETIAPQKTASSADLPTSLAADGDGGVWVGLPELRAMRWKDGQWTLFGAADGLAGKGAVRCVAGPEGRVWFETETSCGYFDGRRFVVLGRDMLLPRLLPSDAGEFWLARATLLLRLTDKLELIETGNLPWRTGSAEIQALCEYVPEKSLWVGTRSEGLFRFADGRFIYVPTSHNVITTMGVDRERNLWVGTWGGGLLCLRPRPVKLHDSRHGLASDAIYSICQDDDGALWLASRSAGVTRLADGRCTVFTTANGWPGGVVTSVCAARGGGVWLGTLGGGLVRWRDGRFVSVGLKRERIESLFQDSRGALWIVTSQAGLLQWRDDNVVRISTNDVPAEITALGEDASKHFWVGTQAGTLHRFDGVRWQRFGRENGLPAVAIQAICGAAHDTLWLGTRGGGLVRFMHDRAASITTRHGLPDDDIRQVFAGAGGLWFSSSRKLLGAGDVALNEVADGQCATLECLSYGRGDGLSGVEFFAGCANTVCVARDGRIWFASKQGAVELDPALPLPCPLKPLVQIEQLLVDGQPHSLPPDRRPVMVPPLPRVVEFRYNAPSFISPEKARFRYRLETGAGGGNWVEAGADRAAAFLNLPPGRYVFGVTATDPVGLWTGVSAELEFTVQPAFWQANWFRAGALGMLLALTAGAIRIVVLHRVRRRLRVLERQHALDEERARIAKDMHDDVGASLTHIALMSESARQDPSLSAEAADDLNRIARAARDVSQTLDQIVWTLNPRNDTLEALVSYLGEYTTEYLAPTGIQLEREMPENVPELPISSEARTHLFLAAKEALHNAVKHAAASKIELRIVIADGCLRVRIADNGKGFSTSNRIAGNGLANMRHRLAAVGGECQIESQPGQGTTVTLTWPLTHE